MKYVTTRLLLLMGLVGTPATPLVSQTPSVVKPSFEVASIRRNTSTDSRLAIRGEPGGRFVAIGATLRMLIGVAYAVRDFQLLGGPNWIGSDRWNIEATANEERVEPPPGEPARPGVLALRLQTLLEQRFALRAHKETRELPVYELTVAGGGLKMKLSEDQSPVLPQEQRTATRSQQQDGNPLPRGSMAMMIGGGELEAQAVPLSNLVDSLSQIVGRTIIDKTALKGLYDIKLQWTPDVGQRVGPRGLPPPGVEPPSIDPSGPSLFTALQEQLGLRLESAKGPVDVLVIDSVQQPTEN